MKNKYLIKNFAQIFLINQFWFRCKSWSRLESCGLHSDYGLNGNPSPHWLYRTPKMINSLMRCDFAQEFEANVGQTVRKACHQLFVLIYIMYCLMRDNTCHTNSDQSLATGARDACDVWSVVTSIAVSVGNAHHFQTSDSVVANN